MAENKGGGCVMPDISMCFGKDCDRREHCYRYMAKPNQVQIYSKFKIQSWMKIQIKDIYNAIFVMQKYM